MKKFASSTVVSSCAARISAIKKHLVAKDQVFVGGEEVEASSLIGVYQEALDTRAATVTAKGEYASSLAARNAGEAKRLEADAALQPYVFQRFGANSTEAHDFGFYPRKVTEKSVAVRAKASLLGQATRQARGTMGKKAKLKIKGSLSSEASTALDVLGGTSPPAPVVTSSTPVSSPAAPIVASTPVVPVAGAANGTMLSGSAHN